MELRDRLRAMGVRPRSMGATPTPGQPQPFPATVGEAAPAEPLTTFNQPTVDSFPQALSRKRVKLDQALPGAWHETPEGPCYAVEMRYPVSHTRGPVVLGHMLQNRPSTLWEAGRATQMRDMDARRLLFLDTETTGLSGGTGTYVFMVGVLFFSESGDEVVVRQYFLSDVSAERALLHALNDLFGNFTAVVTFNGKSFDWPLLETRYIYSRMRCVLRDPPHLDMLGPSRRLWNTTLASCSLETLESQILGFDRGFDVPGWRIPSLYFQYLRAGHAGYVLPVFEHNRHDLLTLLALTCHVGRILDEPHAADLRAAEWLGVAKLYEDLGRFTDSLKAYERGLDFSPSPELRGLALRRLSFLYKHLQQRDEAVAIWERMTSEGTHLMFPYLELAKHHEHRVKDYSSAEHYTLMAMQRAANIVEQSELEHRLQRVRAKSGRQTRQSSPVEEASE